MKRRRLRTTLLVVAVVASFGVESSDALAGSTTIDPSNVAQLRQRWESLAGMGGGLLTASPVTANGVVYVGNSYGRLMVYLPKGPDAYCGGKTRQCQPVWYGQGAGWIHGTPAVAGGKAYVTSTGSGAPTCTRSTPPARSAASPRRRRSRASVIHCGVRQRVMS